MKMGYSREKRKRQVTFAMIWVFFQNNILQKLSLLVKEIDRKYARISSLQWQYLWLTT